MKPYYQNSLTTIYHGDVNQVFEQITLPDGYTTISDPPYNLGYHYDYYDDAKNEKAYLDWMKFWFLKKSVIINYPEAMFKIAIHMNKAPDRLVTWVYPSNTPRQSRSIAWFGCKPDLTRDGQPYKDPHDPRCIKRMEEGFLARLYDWWEINQIKNRNTEKTEHPCQIPLYLMERIVRVTKPDFVFEPFSGSGTTNVACQNLGVKSVGVEMSERYCEIIAKRLDDNLPMFHNDTTK
jgi:site-specific DNA-methyltransferase (adenine-specific)